MPASWVQGQCDKQPWSSVTRHEGFLWAAQDLAGPYLQCSAGSCYASRRPHHPSQPDTCVARVGSARRGSLTPLLPGPAFPHSNSHTIGRVWECNRRKPPIKVRGTRWDPGLWAHLCGGCRVHEPQWSGCLVGLWSPGLGSLAHLHGGCWIPESCGQGVQWDSSHLAWILSLPMWWMPGI